MSEYSSKVNIPEEKRDAVIALLQQSMADAFDLYSQTKQAHWNVVGIHFFSLHELFDTLAEEVLPYVDMMAERITALGGVAEGTIRMAAATSRLPEFPKKLESGTQALDLLIERYAAFASCIREGIDKADDANDMGTSDLFTEVVRAIDKHLYFLEQHKRGQA